MRARYGILVLVLLCAAVQVAAAEEAYVFVDTWGTHGTGDGQFVRPYGIVVDDAGYAYVADNGNDRIQKFVAMDGTYIDQWGGPGPGPGQFETPMDIAVSGSGDVYVADTFNHRIQRFTSTGGYVGQWGSQGNLPGQFYIPCGIAVDGAGNVYVADTFNNRIQKFSAAGVFLAQWGSNGGGNDQFWQPRDVAVDAAGFIFVADTANNRIVKYSPAGAFVAKWGRNGGDGTFGSGDGEFNTPFSISVDAAGNVYVADTGNYRVQKFTAGGTFITKWGSFGSNDGQFHEPAGIAVTPSGDVFVTDADDGNFNRVQVFRRGLLPNFLFMPPNGYPPLAVQFTDTTKGGATSWLWDFGDGATSTERNPLHVYQQGGGYVIKLTVAGSGFPGTWSAHSAISVAPLANGRIKREAEDYDTGGEGVGYHDTTPGNTGGVYRTDGVDIIAIDRGYAVAYTPEGEWTQYSLIYNFKTASFRFPLALRARATGPGRSVEVLVNGQTAATIPVPSTTGFSTVTSSLVLPSGSNSIRIRFLDTSGGRSDLQLDYFTLDPDGGVVTVPGAAGAPSDVDADGIYTDLNGNYRTDFADVVLFFNQMSFIDSDEPRWCFDYNHNGNIDFADVVWLFNHL